MNKNRKRIVIALSVIASSIVTYFAFGLAGVAVASNFTTVGRYGDLSLLEEDFYRVQKCQRDYPSLANREEISFSCGKETIKGYLYENPSPKGVIIYAHGVANLADANGAQMQNYYINHNYTVFAIDMTGSGRSTGKGIKSLYESKYCVANAVKTVKNLSQTKDLPIFLIGHSWGGYGVVTATDEVDGVSAVAAFSGFNTPSEMMYSFTEKYTSKAMVVMKPAMQFGISCTWGQRSYYSAESSIKKHKDIPYVIIHGDNDGTVPFKNISIYDNVVRDNYSNVTTVKLPGMTHGTPWKTLDAVTYTAKCENELKELRKQYKNKLPDDVREEYIASVDKEKASEVNADLLNQIDEIFTSCL
ncbi:MAG: alpha/beta fold hydrolase [Bacilli bacterium]|nr:alpha/beta fold hydrolase [Bacilli bacterium]